MGKIANQIYCLRSYVLTIKIKAAYRIITILVYHYLFLGVKTNWKETRGRDPNLNLSTGCCINTARVLFRFRDRVYVCYQTQFYE